MLAGVRGVGGEKFAVATWQDAKLDGVTKVTREKEVRLVPLPVSRGGRELIRALCPRGTWVTLVTLKNRGAHLTSKKRDRRRGCGLLQYTMASLPGTQRE